MIWFKPHDEKRIIGAIGHLAFLTQRLSTLDLSNKSPQYLMNEVAKLQSQIDGLKFDLGVVFGTQLDEYINDPERKILCAADLDPGF